MQKEDKAIGVVWKLWQIRWNPGQGLPEGEPLYPEVKGRLREWPRIKERNGVLYRVIDDTGLGEIFQYLVPKRLRLMISEAAHDQWGYQGVGRTLSFLKCRAFWPDMSGYVKDHVKECFRCRVSKAPTSTVRPPMKHLLAFKPLECLAIDFLKLDRGKGNIEDVLVLTDIFSKFAMTIPCRHQLFDQGRNCVVFMGSEKQGQHPTTLRGTGRLRDLIEPSVASLSPLTQKTAIIGQIG